MTGRIISGFFTRLSLEILSQLGNSVVWYAEWISWRFSIKSSEKSREKVLRVPEIEQKVLDATSNEPWDPHGSLMKEGGGSTTSLHRWFARVWSLGHIIYQGVYSEKEAWNPLSFITISHLESGGFSFRDIMSIVQNLQGEKIQCIKSRFTGRGTTSGRKFYPHLQRWFFYLQFRQWGTLFEAYILAFKYSPADFEEFLQVLNNQSSQNPSQKSSSSRLGGKHIY